MSIEANPNHAAEAVLKLAAPFWGKPRWSALCASIAYEVQALEDATIDVLLKRMLPAAARPELKILGQLVGEPDTGLLSDDEYRAIIGIRIALNRSDGSMLALIAILQQAESYAVDGLAYNYPDGLRVDVDAALALAPLDTQQATLDLLRQAVSLGVTISVLSHRLAGLTYRSANGATAGGTWGYSGNPAIGSVWAHVVQG